MASAVDDICYSEVCRIHTSVVLYDASVSEVYFSSFCDDEERHRIKIILSQHDVKEVISDIPIGDDLPRTIPDKTPAVSNKKYSFLNEREFCIC
jgi:DNA mismatch repair protein MSH6